MNSLETAEVQLSELRKYRAHYVKEYACLADSSITEGQKQDYKYFFVSLDDAITNQGIIVNNLREKSSQTDLEELGLDDATLKAYSDSIGDLNFGLTQVLGFMLITPTVGAILFGLYVYLTNLG